MCFLILHIILVTDIFCRDQKYQVTANLLRKYLGDYLIASYLNIIQESGYDDSYVKEIEVSTRVLIKFKLLYNVVTADFCCKNKMSNHIELYFKNVCKFNYVLVVGSG